MGRRRGVYARFVSALMALPEIRNGALWTPWFWAVVGYLARLRDVSRSGRFALVMARVVMVALGGSGGGPGWIV